MPTILQSFLGPRVPLNELSKHRFRYALPTVCLVAAAIVLFASFFQPYWQMTLHDPQYPGGLHVKAWLNHLEGDVAEIDGLNHYIGMRPLDDAAQLEKQTSFLAVGAMSFLLLAAIFIRSPWAAVIAVPTILFPSLFLADLYFWLNHFGQNLDPTAALSSSIKPFTPPVLGEGKVGQFRTVAGADVGLLMACVSSVLVIVGLFFHRRAYKPHWDAHRKAKASARRNQQGAVEAVESAPREENAGESRRRQEEVKT